MCVSTLIRLSIPGGSMLVALASAVAFLLTIQASIAESAADADKDQALVPKTAPTSGIPLNPARSYLARGVIRELPSDGQTLLVKHEAIPGFMPRMTMAFTVKNTNELRSLVAGDTITFTVRATDEDSWIEGIKRAGTNDPAAVLRSDPSPLSVLRGATLKPGEEVPDVPFLSENGETIRLSDFRGKALAFTFIFTRCPLPDFCPRMIKSFEQAHAALVRMPQSPTNWQFLSISFDPEHDTPEILSRYAAYYRPGQADRWTFAVAATNVMAEMASQLDFRFANESGSFLHNLRTVVIDAQGRLYRQFDGNRWKPEDLAKAMADAAGVVTQGAKLIR